MAIDARIPLGVVTPDIKTPNEARAQRLALRGAELDNARKENEATLGLLGGVKDQATYDTARQKAKSMGLDTSALPDAYDPSVIDQLTYSSLTAKERLDYELKKQELEIKANKGTNGFEYVGPDGTVVRIGTGGKSQDTQDSINSIKSRNSANAAAMQGAGMERAAELLKTTKTGIIAPEVNKALSVIDYLGGTTPKGQQDLENFQELEGISNSIGADELQKFGGSDTNMELQIAIKSALSPRDTPGANLNRLANKFAARDVLLAKPDFEEQWRSKYGDTATLNEKGQSFSQLWNEKQMQLFRELGPRYREQLKNGGKPAEVNADGTLPPPQGMDYTPAPAGAQPPALPSNGRNLQLPFAGGKLDESKLRVNGIYAAPNGGSVVWDGQHFIEVN